MDKCGEHVSRALIESSGGPDLAREHIVTFLKNTYHSNPNVADFMKAHKELIIPIIEINLNRSRYQGEVMVWSGTADPSFFNSKWGNGSATHIPIQDWRYLMTPPPVPEAP